MGVKNTLVRVEPRIWEVLADAGRAPADGMPVPARCIPLTKLCGLPSAVTRFVSNFTSELAHGIRLYHAHTPKLTCLGFPNFPACRVSSSTLIRLSYCSPERRGRIDCTRVNLDVLSPQRGQRDQEPAMHDGPFDSKGLCQKFRQHCRDEAEQTHGRPNALLIASGFTRATHCLRN